MTDTGGALPISLAERAARNERWVVLLETDGKAQRFECATESMAQKLQRTLGRLQPAPKRRA